VNEHARLCALLPPIEDSPVTHILLGREQPDAGADAADDDQGMMGRRQEQSS
jgi:hypothetical protein